MTELLSKHDELLSYLRSLGSLAVAFSGGVDSTFLLKSAKMALGDNVLAMTARSCSFPERERAAAAAFCKSENIRHIEVESEELDIEGFAQNPPNRCYLCKTELISKIRAVAADNNIANIAEASNLDDEGDYRPGLIAVKERGALSPLRELKFTKNEIRALSRYLGLNTADKPSFACLASRFPYGETITPEKLKMIDKAEQFLLDRGFTQVRARIHGDAARLELIPAEFEKLLGIAQEVYEYYKSIGFSYTALDIIGYRMGSMNETL